MKTTFLVLFLIELLCIFPGVSKADPVTFSNIEVVQIRDNTAVVRWDTDTAATGQIEYGLNTSYGLFTEVCGLSYWHSITITGLTEGEIYHFRIRALDYDENETLSGDSVFTTRTQTELNSIITARRAELGFSGAMLYPQVYYLSPSGNDNNTGLSADSAWENPSFATAQLFAGDTLWVLDGIYDESNTIEVEAENFGIETHWVTIKAYSGMPIWDGNGVNTDGFVCGESSDDPYTPAYVELDGIHIKRFAICEIYIQNVCNIIIKNCKFTESTVGLPTWRSLMELGNGVCNINIDNCTFIDAGNFGINLMGVRYDLSRKTYNVVVTDCCFENTINHSALQMCDYLYNITVSGCTVYDCYDGIGTYYHEENNELRSSNIVVSDNNISYTTAGAAIIAIKTINTLLANNTIDTCVNGNSAGIDISDECNNIQINSNSISNVAYAYDDCHPGYPNISLTFENNNYSNITSDTDYYQRAGGAFIIRDETHQDNDGHYRSELKNTDSDGTVIVEYTDGRVYDYAIVSGSGYTITEPRWHTDKSCFTISSSEDVPFIFDIIPYNMTVIPDTDSLEVSVITWSTTGTFYKKWREVCESVNVLTSHTVGDFLQYSTVEIKVNSTPYGTFEADGSGWIAFDYTGGFSQDTVTFEAEVISTGIEESGVDTTPSVFQLSRNFPNPFQASTEIDYCLCTENSMEHVRLDIYDLSGRLIRNLVNEEQKSGCYQTIWNGNDFNNQSVSGGVYIYHLTAGDCKAEGKMLLLR